ncbi:glycogenin-1 isoform X4 [Castor canadensis]|uniref:Glycogenin-1 isoform X4 n=1 Tax=Castor canadensis TaxID=51338 RepID=A0AC58LDW9_CASCN
MADQAFVTLTTNDAYAKGALVLGSSLKQHRTTRRLVVLATPQVSDAMRKVLETVFDEVIMVDVLDSGDSAHLTLMKRPELGVTLTKLHCWSLTHYSKCVFMDADTLVLANIDDLFEREELSAAPDPGWPDCFNSGVFVYQPSVETYNQLLHLASEQGSFDGLAQVPKLCISWDRSNPGITLTTPKQKVSKASPTIPLPCTQSSSACGGTSSPPPSYLCCNTSALSKTPAHSRTWSTCQELCPSCPSQRSQLHPSLLYPQKSERSGGSRAKPITWAQTPLITSRGSLTHTCSRSAAVVPCTSLCRHCL